MTTTDSAADNRAALRTAGILYLVIIACGLFAELMVRSRLIAFDDAAATAANIIAAPGLFRAGFMADLLMVASDVAIAVVLYVIFRPHGRMLALLAAAMRLIQAAVLGANLLHYHDALLLLTGAVPAAAFADVQVHALAVLSLDAHRHGYDLALVFFGLANLALGPLVLRSGFVPRILGHGLIAAGVVYLIGSTVRFAAPSALPAVAPAYAVPLAAELAFGVWLLLSRPGPAGDPSDGGRDASPPTD